MSVLVCAFNDGFKSLCVCSYKNTLLLFFGRHVGVLQIRGTDFKVDPVPLHTVRPFALDTVSLSQTKIDIDDTNAVLDYLAGKVVYRSGCHGNLIVVWLCAGH